MTVKVYPRFALIMNDGKEPQLADQPIEVLVGKLEEAVRNDINIALIEDAIVQRFSKEVEKQWLQEAAWIYPENDKQFLALLEKNLKAKFGEDCKVWQNSNVGNAEYPQLLCSVDPKGYGGDTCHMWRDGQTFWPMVGDYNLDDMEKVELILRRSVLEFKKVG